MIDAFPPVALSGPEATPPIGDEPVARRGWSFRRRVMLALAAWGAAGGAAHAGASALGCPLGELPRTVLGQSPALALLALAALYAVRPLLMLPAPIVCIAAGAAFGPWIGAALTYLGEMVAASAAFGAARWMRGPRPELDPALSGWTRVLEQRGALAVLLMRLAFVPHDAINFGCGLTTLRYRDFLAGTAVGITPGILLFSLLGGSGLERSRTAVVAAVIVLATLIGGYLLARSLREPPPG